MLASHIKSPVWVLASKCGSQTEDPSGQRRRLSDIESSDARCCTPYISSISYARGDQLAQTSFISPLRMTSKNDSSAPSLRSDRVRLAVLMAPKPGLSFEEFDRYWLDVHAKVFSSIAIVKRNLLKYEQVSQVTGGSSTLMHEVEC